MRTSIKNYLEEELRSYRKLDRRIDQMKDEIMHPWIETDENIGGGKSNRNVSTVEIKATRLTLDARLEALENMKHAIETVYTESGLMGRKFIEEYYFTHNRKYTVTGLADKFNYNKTDLYGIRRDILERLADELRMAK